ncbi:MAG: hypothetical protein LBR81_01860 [Prevotellaceae bacterium]|nr:hypothetical protein [Prevotellaceae bacterium]
MFRNRFNLRSVIAIAIFLAGMTMLLSCDDDDKDKNLYPYTETEFVNFGLKQGLTSYSSQQAFKEGLNEVLQTWLANNPSSNEMLFDGVTYELTNIQTATGAIPNSIWELFWKELDKYSYSIGSCWGISHCQIPSKGGIGTAYALYTIVTQKDGEVSYFGIKANVSPKTTQMRSGEILQLNKVVQEMELFKSAKFARKSVVVKNRK